MARSLEDVIAGLMLSENLGDVHDMIIELCSLAGIPEPEGSFLEGWTSRDFQNVGREVGDDDD